MLVLKLSRTKLLCQKLKFNWFSSFHFVYDFRVCKNILLQQQTTNLTSYWMNFTEQKETLLAWYCYFPLFLRCFAMKQCFYFPVCCFDFLWFSISLKLLCLSIKEKNDNSFVQQRSWREERAKFIKHVNLWKHLLRWWPFQNASCCCPRGLNGECETEKWKIIIISRFHPSKVIHAVASHAPSRK